MKPEDMSSHDAIQASKPQTEWKSSKKEKEIVSCRVPEEKGEGRKWFQKVAAVTKSVWRGLTFPDYDMLETVSAQLGNNKWVGLVGEGEA